MRPYTLCPNPATANRSVLLPWATRPFRTPAFPEPGSTWVWSILVVRLSLLPRAGRLRWVTESVLKASQRGPRMTAVFVLGLVCSCEHVYPLSLSHQTAQREWIIGWALICVLMPTSCWTSYDCTDASELTLFLCWSTSTIEQCVLSS